MPKALTDMIQASMKTIPEERTVKSFMDAWIATNGNSDPRIMLDRYFWSYLDNSNRYFGVGTGVRIEEMDEWCNDTLGPNNWYRSFNKIWFTSESELTMFKLVWSGER